MIVTKILNDNILNIVIKLYTLYVHFVKFVKNNVLVGLTIKIAIQNKSYVINTQIPPNNYYTIKNILIKAYYIYKHYYDYLKIIHVHIVIMDDLGIYDIIHLFGLCMETKEKGYLFVNF